MDIFNNTVGQDIGDDLLNLIASDSSLSDQVFSKLTNGELRYLSPTLPPPFDTNGQPIPNGDPHFWGANFTSDKATATHGITIATHLTSTDH
jgi:hypothetical protein